MLALVSLRTIEDLAVSLFIGLSDEALEQRLGITPVAARVEFL